MDKTEFIKEKLQKLVIEGNQVLQSCGYNPRERNYSTFPSDVEYKRFRVEAANLIKRVCGDDSHHYLELKKISEDADTSHNSYYYKDCLGIVEAAKNDFEGGFLFDLKSLVLAELLDDFIEQSEVLLNHGYTSASASLCGAVLEDTLRKLCEKNSLPIPGKTKIDRLNANLAKAGIYSKLVQKRITALADIRNNADHGHHDKFKKEDVEDMLQYVKRFTADYLG